ncbi:MAG: crosslink repair DNA glycosylase YcaQ family protein, partial [Chloroflexota bacterium]
LDERAPNARRLPREEALAELTTRYFSSHGPATVQDFAWWSGLTVADVKAGLQMVKGQLVEDVIDGKSCWRAAELPEMREIQSPKAYLLPPYDEYTIAYKDHGAIFNPDYREQVRTAVFDRAILIDTQVVGFWRRTFSKGAAVIELVPLRPLSAAEDAAIADAARLYGEFIGMPIVLAD